MIKKFTYVMPADKKGQCFYISTSAELDEQHLLIATKQIESVKQVLGVYSNIIMYKKQRKGKKHQENKHRPVRPIMPTLSPGATEKETSFNTNGRPSR